MTLITLTPPTPVRTTRVGCALGPSTRARPTAAASRRSTPSTA